MKIFSSYVTITIIILTLCSNTVYAGEPSSQTAQQWLGKYESESPVEYVSAITQVADLLFQLNEKSHCKPEKATVGQAAAITQKYLKENPITWNEVSNTMILVSLRLAWPCSSKQ